MKEITKTIFSHLLIISIGILMIVFSLFSWVTLMSKSNWPISNQTTPPEAKVSITNKKGLELYNSRRLAAPKLRSGAGYFSKQSYIITLTMDGHQAKKIDFEYKIKGSYLRNVLVGGLVGIQIVNSGISAMYRLDSDRIENKVEAKSSPRT